MLTQLSLMFSFVYLVIIKARKREESQAHLIRGGGLKTINATRYETVIAMTNLAVLNCQIYGRNALNLKVC